MECYTCVQSDVYYSFPKYHLQVALPVDVFSVVLFLNIPHLKLAVLYRTYASPGLRGGGGTLYNYYLLTGRNIAKGDFSIKHAKRCVSDDVNL